MARKESTPFPTPPNKLRTSAVQRRIEEQFGIPAAELLDALHNGEQKMTIGQMNDHLGITGVYMLMKKLGVPIRSLKQGKQEFWKDPDRLKRTYETGVRSPEVIQRAQEATRQRTDRIAGEKKRKAMEAASQPERKPTKSPAERHIEERFGESARELLYRLYHGEEMSIGQVNSYLGITTARNLMRRLGVPIRTPKEANQVLWSNPDRLKSTYETGLRSPAVIQRANEERRFVQSLSKEERVLYRALSRDEKLYYKSLSKAGRKLYTSLPKEEKLRYMTFKSPYRLGTYLRSKLGRGTVAALYEVDEVCRITVQFPGGLRTVIPESSIGKTYFVDDSEDQQSTPLTELSARLGYARDRSYGFKADFPPKDIRKQMELDNDRDGS